mgnify:CR=1 FL=1
MLMALVGFFHVCLSCQATDGFLGLSLSPWQPVARREERELTHEENETFYTRLFLVEIFYIEFFDPKLRYFHVYKYGYKFIGLTLCV